MGKKFILNCKGMMSCGVRRPPMASKVKKGRHPGRPPAVVDFASCFSDHAVKVSDYSCSSGSAIGVVFDPSLQVISCLYKVTLSTLNELLITVSWSKNQDGDTGLSVAVDDSHRPWKPRDRCPVILKHKKGFKSFPSGNSLVGLHWDITSAKYHQSCPEPVQDFFLVMLVDAELALLLGDRSAALFESMIPMMMTTTAKFSSLLSRRDQVLGHELYSTRVRFVDGGKDHHISIKCKGDVEDSGDSELWVCIDKTRAVHVNRIDWNFRGNQTVFVDKVPVDVMWDVHDWWFGGPAGCAIFMFRVREAFENRLWLEEEVLHRQGVSGFSLLIQAFKSP